MNMQAQRPQPQNAHTTSNGHELRGYHAAAASPGACKVVFYSRGSESDSYDDGLVHSHFWARSSTVR